MIFGDAYGMISMLSETVDKVNLSTESMSTGCPMVASNMKGFNAKGKMDVTVNL